MAKPDPRTTAVVMEDRGERKAGGDSLTGMSFPRLVPRLSRTLKGFRASVRVLIDPQYRWQHAREGGLEYWHIGSESAVKAIVDFWLSHDEAGPDEVGGLLDSLEGHFAVIAIQGTRLIAAADKIRSYPVFYALHAGNLVVSNSARYLKQALELSQVEELSRLEFWMSGYVTGCETIYKDLYQLQAGEFLMREKDLSEVECRRYYLFHSEDFVRDKEETLIDELEAVTNGILIRLMEEAKGARIWVPLSGGLDSRLVLCKLKKLGYDNLVSFSYGPKGNYEAKIARLVAEKLKVPWHFFPVSMRESRRFFHSDLRKKYWDFADGLCTVPNMQDILPLLKMKQQGLLREGDIIVNGQSGDFITGGHIPASFKKREPAVSALLDQAIEKHYSQFLDRMTPENVQRVSAKVLSILEMTGDEAVDRQELCSLYERWEWQERQCKYVVSGQRIYDFLRLRWFLPLWDDAYLRFWERIPFDLKYGQLLYKKYLDTYDFLGLFRHFKPQVWRWPGATIAVVPVGKCIKAVFGETCSSQFYKHLMYIGHYRAEFAPFGLLRFLKNAHRIRGFVAFNIETWMEENLDGVAD